VDLNPSQPPFKKGGKNMDLKYFADKKLAFALIKNGKILYKSKGQGLKPLIFCVKNYKAQMRGATVYDKVVGHAAALLFVYGRVKEIMTPLISQSAVVLFREKGVKYEYGKMVKLITNRQGSDLCPMEKLSQEKGGENFIKLILDK